MRCLVVMKSILLMAALGVPVICLAGNPVKLAPFEPFETAQLDVGERAFSDREFTFLEMPEALKGMTFRRGLFDGGEVEVVAEGELTVISPAKKTSHVSQEQALATAGFVRDESVPVFQAWGKWSCDKASVWRKHVKVGEKLAFGKWAIVCGFSAENQRSVIRSARNRALEKRLRPQYTESELRDILVTQPDFAVFIPPEPGKRHQRVAAGTHDTYNDHFQVINDEKRGRLYAFWTQATREPMADHHTAFRMSKDGGVTWSPLTVLAGRMDTNTTDLVARPNASWQQPMLAKSGRLYCFWSRGYDHRMCGRYSDDGGKTFTDFMPWHFDCGEVVYSSATISLFLRGERNRKQYWSGNIIPPEAAHTICENFPRFPLNIVEIDETYGTAKKDTLTVIDTRRDGESEYVQLSNFCTYQDRESGLLHVILTKFGQHYPDESVWKCETWEYQVELD